MPASNDTYILTQCLKEFKSDNNLNINDSSAFELYSTLYIAKNHNVEYNDIIESQVDGGNDGGFDSILIINNDNVYNKLSDISDNPIKENDNIFIYMIQSKWTASFGETPINTILASLHDIFDYDVTIKDAKKIFNSRVVEKIEIIRKCILEGSKKRSNISIKVCYASKANNIEINSNISKKSNKVVEEIGKFSSNANVVFEFFSAKELNILYRQVDQFDLTMEFKENPLAVSYRGSAPCYIGLIKLTEFLKIITKDGQVREELFESNVRHYQGLNDFNTKIIETIKVETDKDFWWLNNGITIIASEPIISVKSLTIKNPRIVNGLQTSFSVINAKKELLDNDERTVLVKVISSDNNDVIERIITTTNSQTAVSPALLRATEDFQKTIEIYFEKCNYFYDRRKNYYKNIGKPISKIFGIQYTAQAIESIKNKQPASARSKPTSLIKQKRTYDLIFNKTDDIKAYLNCCIVHKNTIQYIYGLFGSDFNIPTSLKDVSLYKNFSYHLSRIYMSVKSKSENYNMDDVVKVDTSYDKDSMDIAFRILDNLIIKYQKFDVHKNIINIAKSNEFDTFINSKLKNELRLFKVI